MGWSELPPDLIALIANQLEFFGDFLSFSGVCHSWSSLYLNNNWTPGPQLPWLMLSNEPTISTRRFLALDQGMGYGLRVPEIRNRRCWGSSYGWLVTTGENLEINLVNPFSLTRNQIHLPPQTAFPKEPGQENVLDWSEFVYKAVIIKKPPEYLVMAIFEVEKHLAIARPGYDSWIVVTSNPGDSFRDVVCSDGCIFALCETGRLILCEFDDPHAPSAFEFSAGLAYDWGHLDQIYLVESLGNLLMIIRTDDSGSANSDYATVGFSVYKFCSDIGHWVEFNDLGDCAIFVGNCSSMSLPASEIVNCEPNCIYFTPDKFKRSWIYQVQQTGLNMGVYNLSDDSFEYLYPGEDSPSYYSWPIWVMPALS